MEHMDEKLLKGEPLPDEAAQRQGFDDLLVMEHLHAAEGGIQVQNDPMTNQVRRDIVAFEIQADHAMSIHFALQVLPIKLAEPAIGIYRGREWG